MYLLGKRFLLHYTSYLPLPRLRATGLRAGKRPRKRRGGYRRIPFILKIHRRSLWQVPGIYVLASGFVRTHRGYETSVKGCEAAQKVPIDRTGRE